MPDSGTGLLTESRLTLARRAGHWALGFWNAMMIPVFQCPDFPEYYHEKII